MYIIILLVELLPQLVQVILPTKASVSNPTRGPPGLRNPHEIHGGFINSLENHL